jgi:dihydropteroate synthase
MINDVWGLKQDTEVADVAAAAGVPLVLTANERDMDCSNIIPQIIADLKKGIKQARKAGVAEENIIIDPGIGFGKMLEQNLEVLGRLAELKSLRKPIMLGVSRKSVIGLVLDLPVEKRLLGTAATVAISIANGADIVRVHDVGEMVQVCRMSDAIVRRS